MNRSATNTSDDRWFHVIDWFWRAVLVSLFVQGAIQTAGDDPSVLHSGNGLLTAAVMLADAGWFLYMMRRRSSGREQRPLLSNPRRVYLLVLLGVTLTVALVLLHREFLALIFADIGVIAFALDGWTSLIPIVLLGTVFLYEVGVTHADAPQIGANLLSVVSTVALIYMLATLVRQRRERDRLIDELQDAHRELQEAHQQLRLAHARDVELAALRERNRLAREMHDSLGHALVLIAIKIEAAQRLQAVDPARAAAEWEETKALVRSTMADLRHSLAGLRLPALEEQPFCQALLELGANLERSTGIEVTSEIASGADALDRAVQETLYRVVQEALANVAKHARARHASVRLELRAGTALLEVADDGIGLAAGPRRPDGHFGITGMRERVEAVGGTLTVGPREGGGTAVRVRLPLQERVDARDPHPVG